MEHNYQITVDSTYLHHLSASEVSRLDAVAIGPSTFHILKNHKAYTAEIVTADLNAKTYTVSVNGTSYEVSIANALDQLIKEMGFLVSNAKQVNEIIAPMPGLILEMTVTIGQEVQENECLLILEAMKMENSFLSPRAGVIKSISVQKGDAVEKGQLLIEFA